MRNSFLLTRLAANLGDDADTTSVYGQLVGVFYGVDGIPERWLAKLAHRALIEDYAEKLSTVRPDVT